MILWRPPRPFRTNTQKRCPFNYRGLECKRRKTRTNPQFSSVQFSHSVMSDSLRPHESWYARPPCPSPTPGVYLNSCPLSRWCHPAILSSVVPFLLPPIPPSLRVFSNESTPRMRWPKYWSFSFSISPSNEYPGLISFRMDWLDVLAVQGTLKSLLQHHSSKASILWPPHARSWLIGKDSDAGKDWGQEVKGMTEGEMAGWHHRLDGHEFGWTPGVGDGQGGLVCYNSWGLKESDTTKWLNWTDWL